MWDSYRQCLTKQLVADQLTIAAEGEAEQAGGAATSMTYLQNPTKQLSGGEEAP